MIYGYEFQVGMSNMRKVKTEGFTRMPNLPPERAANAKVIGMMNNKGGSGKTTTTIAHGLTLARMGYNVLFWDNDTQENLSLRLGISSDMFLDRRVTKFFRDIDAPYFEETLEKLPINIKYPYLYKIKGSNMPLGKIGIIAGSQFAENEATNAMGRYEVRRNIGRGQYNNITLHDTFRAGIRSYLNRFDYILMDTAPAMEGNVLCQLALRAVDEIIIPVDGIESAAGLQHLLGWMYYGTNIYKDSYGMPNATIAMMKYQPDTKSIAEETVNDIAKNAVHRILKEAFGEFVCDHGIKELPTLRNQVYDGFSRKNQYNDLCEEVLDKISTPRPSIFDRLADHEAMIKLDKALAQLGSKTLNRTPAFKSFKFIA